MTLLMGDCLEQMKNLPDNSVDAVVTDPPYGLAFMNKKWDYDVPSVDVWREVYRVLKPGGHVLSFGGTRTYHRMVVNIEDAGFEIRDQVQWIYGSGFPKSHNVSKAIDKMAGVEREVIGSFKATGTARNSKHIGAKTHAAMGEYEADVDRIYQTAPATPEAKQWDGWGSALKPANEPICLARKPLEKGLTLAENVLKYGTGAINVDASRIKGAKRTPGYRSTEESRDAQGTWANRGLDKHCEVDTSQGRWPANVLFDEDAAQMLDAQSGILKQGGASRFFYVAKASKRERNAGLEGMPEHEVYSEASATPMRDLRDQAKRQNHHPTVKPIKLMEYLITLITPPNGTVLDPFMGSGSTGVACKNLNKNFIGIEMNEEYFEIAKKRVEQTQGEHNAT